MAIAKLTKQQKTELTKLLADFDQARQALADRVEEINNEWSDAFEERSERWKEGDTAQEAQERIDALQAFWDELPETLDLDLDALS